jgi:methyltransferase FkbM-like protein
MTEVAEYHAGPTVRAITLDQWLAARGDLASRIACIKIDVEGSEAGAVAGMRRTLTSSAPTVICETTIDSEADAALERGGFTRERIEPGTSSYGNFLYVRRNRRPTILQPPSSTTPTAAG